ncbi:MAG: GspL/Epsl periplasmic domain-containing protein [Thermodesulfobacteriota bacterium]
MPFISWSGLWRPKAAVGLVLSGRGLKAVRLERTAAGPRLAGVQAVDFPLDRAPHSSEITGALEAAGKLLDDRTTLVAGLDGRSAGLHFFNLPFDRPDRVRRVLKYEAEPFFLDSVENMVLDYLPWPAGPGRDRPGVVFGARKEAVAVLLAGLGQADLDPPLILPSILGLIAAGREAFHGRPDRHLLLDLGAEQTSLVLFEGERPVSARSIFYGGRNLTQALAEKRNLAMFEAERLKRGVSLAGDPGGPERDILLEAWRPLILEIQRSWLGTEAGPEEEPPVLIAAGDEAGTPGLEEFLTRSTGLEAKPLSTSLDAGGFPAGLAPDHLAAGGLALLAWSSGPRPNLRPLDLASSQSWLRYRRPLTMMAAGLALIFLFNLTDIFLTYQAEARKYQMVKTEMERLYRSAVPGAGRIVAPVVQLRQELDKAKAGAAGLDQVGGRVLDILLEVSRLAGTQDNLRLTNLSLGPQSLELTGEGGSFEVIDRLKTQLGGLPFFGQVTVGGAKMDPNTRILTFNLSLKRK